MDKLVEIFKGNYTEIVNETVFVKKFIIHTKELIKVFH
jgi:hypothetical protein